MKSGEVLLEVVRNEMVESIHSGHLLITDENGKTVLELGDVDDLIYPRSAVKSLQASAMVRAGLKLTGEQLAFQLTTPLLLVIPLVVTPVTGEHVVVVTATPAVELYVVPFEQTLRN